MLEHREPGNDDALLFRSDCFFKQLKGNNNKPWFEAHRDQYEHEVREPMRELIEELDARIARFAPEIGGDPKRSMFRIHRDIRFSKDESPYKTNAGCWFRRRRRVQGKNWRIRAQPGGTSVA